MTTLRVGVLAEDSTDCDAIAILIRRIAQFRSIGIEKYGSKGCSKLKRKAESKIRDMVRQGCSAVVLLHDLDRNPTNGELNDEPALRYMLEQILVPPEVERLICIPVEELEAWFWSDPEIIREIGEGKGQASPSPHKVKKPKEALIRLSKRENKKPRYSTNDNADLANKLNLDLCTQRCLAFRALRDFVLNVIR
jgi:hypothetical protein